MRSARSGSLRWRAGPGRASCSRRRSFQRRHARPGRPPHAWSREAGKPRPCGISQERARARPPPAGWVSSTGVMSARRREGQRRVAMKRRTESLAKRHGHNGGRGRNVWVAGDLQPRGVRAGERRIPLAVLADDGYGRHLSGRGGGRMVFAGSPAGRLYASEQNPAFSAGWSPWCRRRGNRITADRRSRSGRRDVYDVTARMQEESRLRSAHRRAAVASEFPPAAAARPRRRRAALWPPIN